VIDTNPADFRARITGVVRDGAGDRAGLRVGYIISTVNRVPARNVQEVSQAVASLPPETTTVTLGYLFPTNLKAEYDAATMKATSDYEDVLWAFADHPELIRSIDSIYDSYIEIMRKQEESPLDRNAFVGLLQALKSRSCGSILVSDRRTFYRFRENILRGYVRLRAEDKGLELARDYYSASLASATSTWTPRGARKSRRGMTALDRARMNNPQV
jgi:hypothetical protein